MAGNFPTQAPIPTYIGPRAHPAAPGCYSGFTRGGVSFQTRTIGPRETPQQKLMRHERLYALGKKEQQVLVPPPMEEIGAEGYERFYSRKMHGIKKFDPLGFKSDPRTMSIQDLISEAMYMKVPIEIIRGFTRAELEFLIAHGRSTQKPLVVIDRPRSLVEKKHAQYDHLNSLPDTGESESGDWMYV